VTSLTGGHSRNGTPQAVIIINLRGESMKWQTVTFRRGTKTPKICRDMFIADTKGKLELVIVSNGKIKSREVLTNSEAIKIISENDLETMDSRIFNGCRTYRRKECNDAVNDAYVDAAKALLGSIR